MGLDCSHNAWHGSYGAFMWWRKKLADVAGLPPLELMEGFYAPFNNGRCSVPTLYYGQDTRKPAFGAGSRPYLAEIDDRLPISWNCLKPSPLHELLYHSDCDGEIPAERCEPIASALEPLIPLIPDAEWREKTQQFADCLRAAAAAGEALDFH